MSEHTPGPWVVDESDYGIYQRGTGDQIAEVFSHHPPSELEANARLIARAPEMADTIAALTARVEELEGALKPFAEYGTSGTFYNLPAETNISIVVEPHIVWLCDALRVYEFLNARAAITKGEKPQSWPDGFYPITPTWDQHCASKGCGQRVSVRLEVGGIGSVYCEPCARKIVAITKGESND